MRVVLTVLGTAFACSFVAIGIAVNLPKKYQASALIANPAHVSHPPRMSKLRGEMIAQEHDFEIRWQTSLEQAGARVIEATELKPNPEGLLVSVISADPKESHGIAASVARDLGTPQHEAALAAKWKSFTGITKAEVQDLTDISQLEYLLNDQSTEAGFASYAMVFQQAAEGDEKAIAFIRGEDFERRHAMLQDVAKKLGFNLRPGDSLITAYNPGKISAIPGPMTGTIELIKYLGRFGGLAAGGLLVAALLRWKPDFLRPEPPVVEARATGSAAHDTHDDPW
jgi:hypothetical protein